MADDSARPLSGLKALMIGIANDRSIACGRSRAFRQQGAEPAISYPNDNARRFVEPLARDLDAWSLLRRRKGLLEAVSERSVVAPRGLIVGTSPTESRQLPAARGRPFFRF